MNELAIELNEVLKTSLCYSLLSEEGKRLYFPKGIVAQAAEAGEKAKKYNATAGLATKAGQPFHFSDIMDMYKDGVFKPSDIFSYAPGGGDKKLRKLWKEEMIRKNPTLKGKKFGEPLVFGGLTHAISVAATLFVPAGSTVVCPDLFWDNYDLIFSDLRGAELKLFKFFNDEGHLNVEGMKKALLECPGDARIILNFPNNPTGYSPSVKEKDAIVKALKEVAKVKKVFVIIDDAYFGLFFEEETNKESLFADLVDLDENIFVAKGDAATKEYMVWGFRIGFLTFGGKGLSDDVYDALSKKALGAIRCTVSNCDRPGQSMLVKALEEGKNTKRDMDDLFGEMKERYLALKEVLKKHEGEYDLLKPYPFNSGYFMAFSTLGRSAEGLRSYLLDKYQAGTVNIFDKTLRVAFCSVEKDKIRDLVDVIYKAAGELWN